MDPLAAVTGSDLVQLATLFLVTVLAILRAVEEYFAQQARNRAKLLQVSEGKVPGSAPPG